MKFFKEVIDGVKFFSGVTIKTTACAIGSGIVLNKLGLLDNPTGYEFLLIGNRLIPIPRPPATETTPNTNESSQSQKYC